MAAFDEGPIPLKVGDVVQVTDELNPWHLALVVVTAPKLWGVEGVVYVPMPHGHGMRAEPIALEHAQYRKVGKGATVPRPREAGAPDGACGVPGQPSPLPGWTRRPKT